MQVHRVNSRLLIVITCNLKFSVTTINDLCAEVKSKKQRSRPRTKMAEAKDINNNCHYEILHFSS